MYEKVLASVLVRNQFFVEIQKEIPVIYQGMKMDNGFRADLVVEGLVIVEIKSVEQLAPVHFKELHPCLKLSGLQQGNLVNFKADLIKMDFSVDLIIL